jgi:cytochrome c6
MKLKKVLAVFVVLAFFVVGCSSSDAQDSPPVQSQSPQEMTETSEENNQQMSQQPEPQEEEEEEEEESNIILSREAADLENGKQVFLAEANCTQCHRGGINTVIANKHLGKDALEKYNMDSMEAIAHQVRNGKNAMPAYGRRLSDEQIRDVAAYVLSQADKGWTNQ